MMQYPTTSAPAAANRMMNQQSMNQQPMARDWSEEVTPKSGSQGGMNINTPVNMPAVRPRLDMTNNLPSEVVEAPTSREEALLGSLKAALIRNKGNFIVATFLIGTQNTVSWEGILYEVGNDYVTIYQEGRDRYIVCDMYSLKYMEFYDTRRRELCDAILRERGWQGQM